METILLYAPFLVITLAAQWSDRSRAARWLTYGLVLLFDAAVAMVGLVALAVPASDRTYRSILRHLPGLTRTNWIALGVLALATSLLVPLCLLPSVRRALARLLPVDPGSAIHAAALALATLAVGLTIAQLPLVGGLESLAYTTVQVSFQDALASTLPMGVVALAGVGLFIRRRPREAWARLGLEVPTWRQVGLVLGLMLAIVAVSYAMDVAWRELDPETYAMIDAVSETLFAQAGATWVRAVAISLLIGVGEELLFRGALQPRFGFWLTVVVFTAAHAQYGLTPATLQVFGAALLLGWLRRRTNTTTCILLHVLNDAAALILGPLMS